jgi:hypothetical protein
MALASPPARQEERAFDDHLTAGEASFQSHKHVDAIRRAMRAGRLRYVLVKGTRLIPPDALAEWLRRGEEVPE